MNERIAKGLFYAGQLVAVFGIGLRFIALAFVVGGILMTVNGISLMTAGEDYLPSHQE